MRGAALADDLRLIARGNPPMRQHILIIDDDDETLEMLELVLQDAGYDTVGHTDHATAYDRIQAVHPDLVITDLMDGSALVGWNTLMAASLDPDTREIPVLLMSCNTAYLSTGNQECIPSFRSSFWTV